MNRRDLLKSTALAPLFPLLPERKKEEIPSQPDFSVLVDWRNSHCKKGQGTKQCRYLQRGLFGYLWNDDKAYCSCLKLSEYREIIDQQVADFLKTDSLSDLSGIPVGDNCPGIPKKIGF